MKIVTCPMCGAQFETSRPNKKYCSFTCREASVRLRRMKWEAENPDYIRLYMRQYRSKERQDSKK